ncbi:MAG: copper oxidase [Elusimicrobia bacterium]|nr:copper oxidase [Elusimicrobiota bacterium]
MKIALYLTLIVKLAGSAMAAPAANLPYTPVVTPNGTTLDWKMEGGVKIFRLAVEECKHEVAPGMVIDAWCYNGRTPGPTIEAVEGDRVRILVTNKLPEPTAVHWHGIILPSGMDGVSGLSQKPIKPGETFAYEFTLRQHGTQMYHSHGDEMVQIGLGTMGFFIIHPRTREPKIDRDYAIFLNEWFIHPDTSRPNPNVMTDFNIFTFNSRAFPGTAALVAKVGERVRIRFGNVGQESHPIHIHGHTFKTVATDGGDIPESARWPDTTTLVAPGQTRDIEFIARAGDWALHCHRRHHPMNAMGHDVPNMLGVNQDGVERKVREQVPGYMAMGEKGMDEHSEHAKHMQGPDNTLPMMGGDGPFGSVGMGGMFTIVKVRQTDAEIKNPGWYKNEPGTVADRVGKPAAPESPAKGRHPAPKGTESGSEQRPASEKPVYVCPMHPDVKSNEPGKCPKCGMDLELQEKGEDHKH